EEFLKKYPEAIKEISAGDVNKLVEDLHIHQIELEIQNEELRRAQSELEVSRDGYSDLYDFAPVGYVTISEKGLILQANLACADMLGVERSSLIGKPFSRFVKKDDQDVFYLHRKALFETKAKQVCKLILVRKDRTQFHAQLECILIKDPEGSITQTRTAISDISERKRVEEVLRNAHSELERRVEDRTVELVKANEELKTEIEDRKRVELELREALSEIKRLKDQLEAERTYLQEEIKLEYNYENIIGQSDELKYTLYKVEQIAPTDTAVIVLGETGTGKELIVRAIHGSSPRKDRPLLKVNCAALPLNLIESELFGHEKGAFTDAFARRLGRFEVADGATLFLDEIGELPLELQAKLLKVIQDSEFERLGSSRTIKVDVRIIAATNRNLEEEVRNGRFRKDLWYRLNIFPITMPPLRNRLEDLPLLVKFIVDKVSKKLGKSIDYISKSVMNALQNYHWPGNVRELEHVIERAVINSSDNKLRLMDTLAKRQEDLTTTPKTMEKVERDHIVQTLEETRWKVSGKNGASEILGLNSSTLRARMRKLGIRKP
ncbi:MAG: sigma 54-interacting transcriptional regulator, partial [Desulfobacterales bacterium]|nr:sigma 54-interacting transcriptional regulator [Desulfobacterales bacterium]